jgi:UDP:flavonoid glycosyltransferase YjiC (YdhE family)
VPALRRIVRALSTLPVRAVVTVGPALSPDDLASAENVFVCRSAPHSQLLSHAAAVVTHAGHGTAVRSLAAGVPLLCMPMGRDQNDNAARVVARGAGLRVNAKAGVKKIQQAIRELLQSPRYRENAQKLGKQIVEDVCNSSTLEVLEEVASFTNQRA